MAAICRSDMGQQEAELCPCAATGYRGLAKACRHFEAGLNQADRPPAA